MIAKIESLKDEANAVPSNNNFVLEFYSTFLH